MAAERKSFTRRRFMAYGLMAAAAGAAGLDALVVEPAWVEVTRHRLLSNKLKAPLRIVHLSDLHLDAYTRRDGVPETVNAFDPDIVVITGDYCNYDSYRVPVEKAIEQVRGFVGRLRARHGVFGCFGNWDEGREKDLFDGSEITVPDMAPAKVDAGGVGLTITASEFSWDYAYAFRELEDRVSALGTETLNILLYHSPDIAGEVAGTGKIDLYLCGHTHGGQVRVPFLDALRYGFRKPFPYPGSIETFSRHGSKYDAGMYRIGGMDMYVNRGLGMEGGMVPVRFFCRPEIAVIDIIPGN